MNGPSYPEAQSHELASTGEVDISGQAVQTSASGDDLYFPFVHAVHGPPVAPAHPALHVQVLFVAVSCKLAGHVVQAGYAPDTVQLAEKPFLVFEISLVNAISMYDSVPT